jgi:hypothetical protein
VAAGVDQWSAESWTGLGEKIDGLHNPGVGRRIEAVDLVADLVDEVMAAARAEAGG